MTKRLAACAASILFCLFMTGCAHPINMNPDLASVAAPSGSTPINKKAGYVLPDSQRALEITTAGGGGDKVRYFPYRDIEAGFYKALSEAFTSVAKVANPKDAAAVQASGVAYIITPDIKTTSSSASAFTWPPTQFSVELTCAITDPAGKLVQTVRVNGNGNATFDEFKTNFSLAAVRASNDALQKLVTALGELPELRK